MPKLDKKPATAERRIFSTNLKAARQYVGLTLQQVSTITDLSLSYISHVENGNQNVTISAMTALSHAVQFPLYALLNPRFKPESFDADEWSRYLALVQQAKPDILEQKLLAERTRYFRKLAGLTQAQVDQFAGLADKTSSHLERQALNVSLDLIAPLASTLGTPLYKFFNPDLNSL